MTAESAPHAATDSPSWLAPRNTKVGSRHAVAAGHYLAASAAFAILEAGGNAIDAGCGAGHRARRAAARRGQLRRRRADHHPHWPTAQAIRSPAWALARVDASRPLHARARRDDPGPAPAHRRAGRAGRLDHGAAPARHDDASARCRCLGDPLRGEGFSVYPLLVDRDRLARERLRRWPVQRRDLPAERPACRRSASACPVRPRAHAATDGRRRGPRRRRRPVAGLEAARAPSTAATSRGKIVRYQRQKAATCPATTWPTSAAVEPPVSTRWRDHDVITCDAWCQGPTLPEALLHPRGVPGIEARPGAQLPPTTCTAWSRR